MVNVMVANMLLKSRLRSHITTQYLKQQMHHTRQLLEHRPQENVVDHQDVKSFGGFVCLFVCFFAFLNVINQNADSSILFTQVLYS